MYSLKELLLFDLEYFLITIWRYVYCFANIFSKTYRMWGGTYRTIALRTIAPWTITPGQ
jgi:hypothetical protein